VFSNGFSRKAAAPAHIASGLVRPSADIMTTGVDACVACNVRSTSRPLIWRRRCEKGLQGRGHYCRSKTCELLNGTPPFVPSCATVSIVPSGDTVYVSV
jgi:hypothetical protein